jgi:hypothetical protein
MYARSIFILYILFAYNKSACNSLQRKRGRKNCSAGRDFLGDEMASPIVEDKCSGAQKWCTNHDLPSKFFLHNRF